MQITRRGLLASIAAVAAAAYAPRLSARENAFLEEHRWATRSLLKALETRDFTGWTHGGAEDDLPNRWRLARALVGLRELPDPSELEIRLRGEIGDIWLKLTVARVTASAMRE